MLTVKSLPPLTNSLVPSSGSTRKKSAPVSGMRPSEAASSAITGTPGASSASAAVMMRFGGAVGLGDRRGIGLPLDVGAGAAHGEDLLAGADGDRQQGFGQFGVGGEVGARLHGAPV